jgi:energy-coupling factor transporter ATP-binding protein EcfA2
VVSQETYLFHASVRENLRFARPDATDEEIEDAARTARIHDLIASLPDGYDTVVGERGYRFSGGEKQRMAIARTVLRNPPVLVLDEATSSLDTQTEAAVQAELERLSEGRTTITIAHRLSTVRDADQIVVLDKGRSSSAARTRSCSSAAALYAALVARDVDDPDLWVGRPVAVRSRGAASAGVRFGCWGATRSRLRTASSRPPRPPRERPERHDALPRGPSLRSWGAVGARSAQPPQIDRNPRRFGRSSAGQRTRATRPGWRSPSRARGLPASNQHDYRGNFGLAMD